MNDHTVLATDAEPACRSEVPHDAQQESSTPLEMLLGHVVVTLLFLIAVLLRTLL